MATVAQVAERLCEIGSRLALAVFADEVTE